MTAAERGAQVPIAGVVAVPEPREAAPPLETPLGVGGPALTAIECLLRIEMLSRPIPNAAGSMAARPTLAVGPQVVAANAMDRHSVSAL